MSAPIDSVQKHHKSAADIDEGFGRYSAYLMRLRTLITSSTRYIAYSSDIGEAFRPLTRPEVVRTAYAVSWAYIFADVGYTCYKAVKNDNGSPTIASEVSWIAARRATFQTFASLIFPAITIHSVVKYSAPLFSKAKSLRVRTAGPTVAGLLTVPLLPTLFDHSTEVAVERLFDMLEYKVAAWNGDKHASESLEKGSLWRGFNERGFGEEKKNNKPSAPSVAQLAILGMGVDLVYLPRMRQMMARHAQRIKSLRAPFATTVQRHATATDEGEARTSPYLQMAAQHFARRTLTSVEMNAFNDMRTRSCDEQMRFLATRYAFPCMH